MAAVGVVSSKVELSLSCSNLKDLDAFSKSDPVVFLYEQKGSEWVKLGRTEVIDDNLSPKVHRRALYIFSSNILCPTICCCLIPFVFIVIPFLPVRHYAGS